MVTSSFSFIPLIFNSSSLLFLYNLIHYGLSVLKQHLADVDSFLRSRKKSAVETVIRYFGYSSRIGGDHLRDTSGILAFRVVFIYLVLCISITLLHDVLNQRIGIYFHVGVVTLAVERVGEGIAAIVWIQTVGKLPCIRNSVHIRIKVSRTGSGAESRLGVAVYV